MSTAQTSEVGVLLVGYGGPRNLDAVEGFLAAVMARPPSEELVHSVRNRYLALGGSSPLLPLAEELAHALSATLGDKGWDVPVRIGYSYSDPSVANSIRELYASGVRRLITVPLSPFEAEITTVTYRKMVTSAVSGLLDMSVLEIPLLGGLEGFLDAHAARLSLVLEEVEGGRDGRTLILFSAHSLPMGEVADSTSIGYLDGLKLACDGVASRISLPIGGSVNFAGHHSHGSTEGTYPWMLAFQSKGQRPGQWLGPSAEEISNAALTDDYDTIVVCPVGFALDNMETLYDLDVELADLVISRNGEFARSPAPNSDPLLVYDVVDCIIETVGSY